MNQLLVINAKTGIDLRLAITNTRYK